MYSTIGGLFQMSTPSPFTKRRDYEVYLRGPISAPQGRFGTRDAWRLGEQYLGRLCVVPAPQDAAGDQFGIQAGGSVTVEIADPDAPDT